LADLQADVQPGGPVAVVLLHGQPGRADDWRRVADLLFGRYTLVIPDRPGYGRTGGAATGFAGNAAAVIGLLDRLGLDRAVIAGHSWAGGVALAAASGWPERVGGLVLVSSVGPGEHFGWSDRVLAAPVLGESIAALVIGGAGLLLGRNRVQSLVHCLPGRLGQPAREAVDQLTRLTSGGASVWRSFVVEQRALFSELDGLAAGLAAIRAPTAVVHGRADRLVPPPVAEAMAAAIPGSALHLVPGAGHLLPLDHPAAVAAAVEQIAAR
jgi:pimeloyl-ACP methyl ester carboxylesterase